MTRVRRGNGGIEFTYLRGKVATRVGTVWQVRAGGLLKTLCKAPLPPAHTHQRASPALPSPGPHGAGGLNRPWPGLRKVARPAGRPAGRRKGRRACWRAGGPEGGRNRARSERAALVT